MKRLSFLFFLLSFIIFFQLSFGQTFEKKYGDNWANKVVALPNGEFLLVGISGNVALGVGCAILKTDSDGSVLFQKKNLYNYSPEGVAIVQEPNGELTVAGHCYKTGTYFHDFLMRTDSVGDTLWIKLYGSSGSENALDMIKTNDNGYMIAGAAGGTFPSFFKVDGNGVYQWGYISYMMYPYSIKQTYDGGYIMAGYTGPFMDSWAIEKRDSLGGFQWIKSIGNTGSNIDDKFEGVIQAPDDSNYYACGTSPFSLVKFNQQGDTIWSHSIGSNNFGHSLVYTYDHNIIISTDDKICKFDTAGNLLWSRIFPNTDLYSIQNTLDSGYVIAGAYLGSITEILLIRTDSLGNVTNFIGINSLTQMLNNSYVYPNPLTETALLQFNNTTNATYHLTITDVQGSLVETGTITGNSYNITKTNKHSGIYFYRLTNQKTGEMMKGKFVIE